MVERSTFPYGASYSSLYFDAGEWERDLALMQRAGMNLVRVGDVHGSWDQIEPEQGVYRLDGLNEFYICAAQFDINLLLSTGVASPPLWMATKHPEVLLLSNRGDRYPLGASYHWACIHHPEFLSAGESYIRALLDFTAQHSNHFGWQLSNEVGLPFLPTRDDTGLSLYCYCDHSQAAFQHWLREKYGTIEALTDAWTWGTTNFVYHDWEQIQAPETRPLSWSSLTRWLDWRIFWQDAFASFIGWQHELIRSMDPDHPTSVNTFHFKGHDRFGTYLGLDQWKIAQETDHIGYDLYPGSGDKRKTRPEHNSIFLDHGRSVSRSQSRAFWVHEIESGPIGGWLMGPQHATDDQDILNLLIECLGHGAKLLLFMPWREWAYQQIRWGAIVDLDGNPTLRYEAAASFGSWMQANAGALLTAHVPVGEVAILDSKTNAIALRGMGEDEQLFAAQRGAYLAYWEEGYSVDFISPEMLNFQDLKRYKHICMPLMGLLSTDHAESLSAYVDQGGTLIGFARLATLDERAWSYHQIPIEPLGTVFGIVRTVPDSVSGGEISYQGSKYPAHLRRDRLELMKGAKSLATFTDGSPAVTINKLGKGAGVYFGTHADAAVIASPDSNLFRHVLQDLKGEFLAPPRARITSDNLRRLEIDHHLLEGEEVTWVLFSNYADHATTIDFQLSKVRENASSLDAVFPIEEACEFTVEKGVLQVSLRFNPKEVKILKLT